MTNVHKAQDMLEDYTKLLFQREQILEEIEKEYEKIEVDLERHIATMTLEELVELKRSMALDSQAKRLIERRIRKRIY